MKKYRVLKLSRTFCSRALYAIVCLIKTFWEMWEQSQVKRSNEQKQYSYFPISVVTFVQCSMQSAVDSKSKNNNFQTMDISDASGVSFLF